ncbi:hypothetical protein SSS_07097 [Sarcoptes scabiei]|uniref:TIL domain-containing protein n=1 Tax=Sarcoptes scabiei TaxID=52283 RepID=A0A834R395_SARSC|nr:hypothetical protein SSS_07097 [Sarcoptes scabiei]
MNWSRYGGCDKNCLDLLGNVHARNGTGPCIPPSQCPHRCPKHQHWSKNVGCEKTCHNLSNSRPCSLLLKAGCKCDKGYVRRNKDGTGPCIPPSQCPHRCPKHQHWSKNAGCKCDKGYVRRNKDGTGPCIPPSQCPHRCPKHEHWTRDKGCEKTCGNLGGNRNCPLILTSGCTCNRHFVRKHPDGTGPYGNRNCPLILTAGCTCNRHLVRKYLDGTGPCIPPSQCPHRRCPGKHEKWDKCRDQVVCEDGYVRKNSHGPCIRKRDCWRK